jgi:hypothetical protein
LPRFLELGKKIKATVVFVPAIVIGQASSIPKVVKSSIPRVVKSSKSLAHQCLAFAAPANHLACHLLRLRRSVVNLYKREHHHGDIEIQR